MSALTLIHTSISLAAIPAGIGMSRDLLAGRIGTGWTKMFLATILASLLTSFLFPFQGPTPALSVAALCLIIFIPVSALVMRSAFGNRRNRLTVAVGALLLLYFDCMVLVVQSYQKIPVLHALAPAGSEPPVLATQLLLLLAFLWLGFRTVKRVREA